MANDNRLGRFIVSKDALLRWRAVLPLFKHMVVLDTRYRWDTQMMEYFAFSDLFEEVEEGHFAPWYSFQFETLPSGEIVTTCINEGESPP